VDPPRKASEPNADFVRHLLGVAADVAYLECNRAGTIAFANGVAERLLASRKLTDEPLASLYPANDRRDGKPEADLHAALQGQLLEEDGWRRRVDGTTFPACVRMSRIDDDRIAVVLTQKKLNPDDVGVADAFGFFLENAPIAIIAADRTGRITHCNLMAAALTGRSRDAVVGMNVADPIFAENPETVRKDFANFVATGVMEAEYRVKRLDGPSVWLWVRGVRLKDDVYLGFLSDITTKKSSERMLHAGEDRLYLAFAASGLGVWNWEANTARVLLSRRCYQIFGIEQFSGSLDALRELVHADDRPDFVLRLDRALQERSGMRTEVRIRRPDDEVRWVSVTAQADFDTAGRAVRLMGTLEDVTEKAALRREAERAHRRYHALIAATSFSVWSANADGTTYRVATAGGEEESKEISLDNIHPDDQPAVIAAMRQAMETKRDFAAEMRMLDPDGAWRYRLSRAVALCDDAGQLEEWIGITIDSDPWRSAEAKLRESEERLALALTASNTGVWEWNVDTGAVHWSPECSSILGYRAFDHRLESFARRLHPEDRARLFGEDQDAALAGPPFRVEYRFFDDDGRMRWIASYGKLVVDAHGARRLIGVIQDETERVEMVEKLRHSKQQFKELAESMPPLVWTCRGDGWCDYLSPQWIRYTGISEEEQLGYGWLQVLHPEDRSLTVEAWNATVASGVPWQTEFRIRRKDGAYRWFKTLGCAIRNDAGEVVRWIGTNTDIEDQKQLQQSLAHREEHLRVLVDGLADHAVCLLDAQGNIVTWNAATERIHLIPSDQIGGQPFSILWPRESLAVEKPNQLLSDAASQGSVAFEGWRRRMDASRFWASGTVSAIRSESGEVRGYVIVTRDMTQQRHAEQLIQSILNNTLDAIITVDEAGRILSFNRAAETIFGYKSSDVISKEVTILMPEPHRSKHSEYIRDYLRSGVAKIIGANREVDGLRSDGTVIPVDLAVTEFFLDERRHFIGIVRDISERRTLESQLRQSQKMEAIGLLAGGVAHDFNNLLTVIAGYGQSLLNETDWEDARRGSVAAIMEAQERAAGLTRQLLAFSRQSVLEPRVLDLNIVVGDTERLLRRVIGEDIVLSTSLDPAVRPIKVDPAQVSQVLMNLAVNARDAMPKGGALRLSTANIEVRKGDANDRYGVPIGQHVLLEVADTGHGMSPEVQARMFEPFFTTKPVGKGTGLGLATVYGIVRASGGNVLVSSEVGRGTTFRIFFPASEETIRSQVPVASPITASQLRGTETILLVEDETSVRSLIKIVLEKNGYQVLDASDGEDALRVFDGASGNVDILVTDIVMPHRNGPELAALLREKVPDLRVLFTSGYTEDAVVRQGLEQNPACFLQKPYAPSALLQKIRQVLDRKR
jgi:two-component system cell cycle sensor histidine kinase/response regulator CckA